MATTTVAYGDITILDLMDMATYIYYAEDSEGEGKIDILPFPGAQYIGIYSGATLGEQPLQPDGNWGPEVWSGWTKYVGERGEGCREFVYYAVSDSPNQPPLDNEQGEPFSILIDLQGENALDFKNGGSYYFVFDKQDGKDTFELAAQGADGTLRPLKQGMSKELAGVSEVWKLTLPEPEEVKGKYLWTKHVLQYDDGDASIWYNVTLNGVDGNPGRGIKEIIDHYRYSDSGEQAPPIEDEERDNWLTREEHGTLPERSGTYLWTWYETIYTEGEPSNSFSVAYQGRDGESAYFIETNTEEVVCFYVDSKDPSQEIETSPTSVSFCIYPTPRTEDSTPIEFQHYKMGYITNSGTYVDLMSAKNYFSYGSEYQEGDFGSEQKDAVSLFFNISQLLNDYKTNRDSIWPVNVSLKFALLNEKGEELGVKILTIREGLPSEMLQFTQTATKITAAISKQKLEFSAEGLSIYGTGLEIWDSLPEYINTLDYPLDPLKTYYIKTETGYVIAKDLSGYVEETKRPLEVGGDYYIKDGDNYNVFEATAENQNTEETIYQEQFYYETNQKRTLYADEDGNLFLRGTVYANDGYFRGEIEATKATFQSGEIGGLVIEDNGLASTTYVLAEKPLQPNGVYYIRDDETDTYSRLVDFEPDQDGSVYQAAITINGKNGSINAETISLGQGARVKDYLEFSDGESSAFLYNPQKHGGDFLQAGNIKINTSGRAQFGSIQVDGENSTMSGNGWTLAEDWASFNNVTVSGKIQTAVFETATTQAVGSGMIFMPSFKIQQVKDYAIFLEDGEDLSALSKGNRVWLISDGEYVDHIIETVDADNHQLTVSPRPDQSAVVLLVIGSQLNRPQIIAQEGADSLAPSPVASETIGGLFVFGINSSHTKIAQGHVLGRGLTIAEYGKPNAPRVFLGDLSQLGVDYGGYGLYSDHVYLSGALTTRVGQNSYAGVNTLSNAEANCFDGKDTSRIVFWAGAEDKTSEKIKMAPFQVTERGSVYAARATLTDSMFVNGSIEGADIYAARIHGRKDGQAAALTLYDTAKGISFRTGYVPPDPLVLNDEGSEGVETFSININGLACQGKNFISINGSEVSIQGDIIKTGSTSNYLALTSIEDAPVLQHVGLNNNSCGLYFQTGETSFRIKNGDNENIKMIWSGTDTKLIGTVTFAEKAEDTNFQYKVAVNEANEWVGYDLYII